MADLLDLLRALRPEQYDNNLPASAGTRGPLLRSDADVAAARERLGMGGGSLEDADTGDEHYGDLPDSAERPYLGQGRAGQLRRTLEERRAKMRQELSDRENNPEALDARVINAYRRRFGGTTPGSPDFMARATGEVKPADPNVRYEDTELRRLQNRPALAPNVAGYEDTEFRRGAPAAPAGALPVPQENPRGVGSVPGDTRRLSDEERLKVLKSQLNDPNRDMTADAELRREIAMMEKRGAGQTATGALGERPIDTSRPIVHNPDGSFSTERTITVEADGRHYLIPTIVGGKQLPEDEAIRLWKAGRNPEVGVFGSAEEAERAAQARSRRIGEMRGAEAGALSDVDNDAGAEPDSDADDAPQGALASAGPQAPAVPRKALDQAFRERVAAAEEKVGRDLTDKEKNQLKLDFFLRLMAAGGQRGNNLATNVGAAGLGTSGEYTKALERHRQSLKDAREDAYRETMLSDKDRDNQLAEAREAREGRQGDQRLALLRDQISQGKYDIKVGGRGGNFVIIDKKTGKVTDTGIKAADSVNSTRPAALQILDHLKDHPEDAEQLYRVMKVDDGQKEESKLLEQAGKIMSSDLTGKMSPREAVRRARDMLDEIRNPGAGGELPKFDSPEALDAARKAGKVKRGDRVMTPQGERVVR